jgi:hypothetical protein
MKSRRCVALVEALVFWRVGILTYSSIVFTELAGSR